MPAVQVKPSKLDIFTSYLTANLEPCGDAVDCTDTVPVSRYYGESLVTAQIRVKQ